MFYQSLYLTLRNDTHIVQLRVQPFCAQEQIANTADTIRTKHPHKWHIEEDNLRDAHLAIYTSNHVILFVLKTFLFNCKKNLFNLFIFFLNFIVFLLHIKQYILIFARRQVTLFRMQEHFTRVIISKYLSG